jgi:hypothetical protein
MKEEKIRKIGEGVKSGVWRVNFCGAAAKTGLSAAIFFAAQPQKRISASNLFELLPIFPKWDSLSYLTTAQRISQHFFMIACYA